MQTFYYITILFLVLSLISKFTKKDSFLRRFTTPFIWLVSALILAVVLLPIGFIWDIGKSARGFKLKKILTSTWQLFKELLLSLSWLARQIAVGIDIVGNVIAGEFLEDAITHKDETLFRKSGITISASIGQLIMANSLNKKMGKVLNKILDLAFEKNHSVLAYEDYLKDNEKTDRNFKIFISEDDKIRRAKNLGGLGGIKK